MALGVRDLEREEVWLVTAGVTGGGVGFARDSCLENCPLRRCNGLRRGQGTFGGHGVTWESGGGESPTFPHFPVWWHASGGIRSGCYRIGWMRWWVVLFCPGSVVLVDSQLAVRLWSGDGGCARWSMDHRGVGILKDGGRVWLGTRDGGELPGLWRAGGCVGGAGCAVRRRTRPVGSGVLGLGCLNHGQGFRTHWVMGGRLCW